MIRKVLFVDDDQIMLFTLQKKLEKYNHTFSMVLAEDGFEGVLKLKENPFSLIVLDLKMPRMDGVGLLSHISDNYPDIPVIILSGYRIEEMRRLVDEKGVIAYISKPFKVDELARVILSALRKEAEGGTLHNVSPVVFLQLMEMESRTCTIRIIDRITGKGGVLFFREGKLYDARVDHVQGLDAAHIVFTWEDVTLFIRNECAVDADMIHTSLQSIIMTAVGMKDEQETYIPPSGSGKAVEEELPPAMEMSPHQGGGGRSGGDEESRLDGIRDLLSREIGERCGLEELSYDNKADEILQSLSELGAMFNCGLLKAGYITRGNTPDEVILPGTPPIVMKVSSKCSQDKILQVLGTLSR